MDDVINAGIKLLEMSYLAMGSLQSFNVCRGNFVQILNVTRNHWITVSRNCELYLFHFSSCY